jgi:hypothetical protein
LSSELGTSDEGGKFGGLGVLDLDLFSRALCLRWLWYEWKDPERPWVGTEPPVTEVDRQLFRLSTIVAVGNGLTTKFWNSSVIGSGTKGYSTKPLQTSLEKAQESV